MLFHEFHMFFTSLKRIVNSLKITRKSEKILHWIVTFKKDFEKDISENEGISSWQTVTILLCGQYSYSIVSTKGGAQPFTESFTWLFFELLCVLSKPLLQPSVFQLKKEAFNTSLLLFVAHYSIAERHYNCLTNSL